MLINLRNALMSGKRLPYDAEVEYLQSTGTQYIETGVTRGQTSQLRLQSTMSFSGSASANAFGWGQSLQGPCVGIKGAQPYMYFNLTGTDEYSTLTYTANTIVTIDIDGASGKVTINDGTTTYTATRTVSTWTGSGEMVLFGFANSAGVQPRNQRIYACKIYVNGVLVRDYIPVRKGTVGYLYDRVTGKLFGNAGTGDFVLGPDVVPVEYIESHGTEYIDTPFVFNSSTDTVEASFALLNGSKYKWCFGSHDTSARCAVGSGDGTDRRNVAYGNGTTQVADSYFLNTRCTFVANGQGAYLNSTQIRVGASFQATVPLRLFGLNSPGDSSTYTSTTRIWSFVATRNGIDVLNYTPIRVGTGSTWEGAMMDTLTRRIYRNAGTGAFTYGNDLKYGALNPNGGGV